VSIDLGVIWDPIDLGQRIPSIRGHYGDMEIKAQLSRLGLFDSRVPQYTSYPTATHFKNDIGPGHYLNWVGQLTPETPISIYLHIPFCRRLCWFCACRTQGTSTMAPVRAYLDTLLAEIAMLRGALPQGVKIARIHWGGRHADAACS
jgi:oxygen-independent coproporphyrinogen-3 oxidase